MKMITGEDVVVVNSNDEELGSMEKLQAHREGVLHRAFSVFLLNALGEMLLQKRAPGKYHSPDLWTNACCSHPRPGETTDAAAKRRLQEEMGIVCDIEKKFSFVYRADFENGLTEHEYDHVFLGQYSDDVMANPEEVSDWKYMPLEEIREDLKIHPEKYTYWFRIAFPMILQEPDALPPSSPKKP
ncbi:isopentenyl-diphosphate Delta-isomerase [Arcticibacter sp. MXS-1]|uniref:isopentenyl-diphosphate Delta-isomerase n=1 Tax=Arcticibacter sp. MXS-1 TaxID=3341726 RepID=UPI0035A81E1C